MRNEMGSLLSRLFGLFGNRFSNPETICKSNMAALSERYEAAMVLSGAGDALGYKNGSWEFCHSGLEIYTELKSLGGLKAVKIKPPQWIVSDDTVMLLATGEALSECSDEADRKKLFLKLAEKYIACMRDMDGRAPGACCSMAVMHLKPWEEGGYNIPFNKQGGGCGAAMRSMCIGLRYPRANEVKDLVAVSVEAGRMTHHHPTGYLGSVASALFTSLAIQGRPLKEWGRCLLDTLPLALAYITETGHEVDKNKQAWSYFTNAWTDYLTSRNLLSGKTDPVFPQSYGFTERDKFYKNVSYSGWGGSSGHDAPMIAYDALLGANWDWEELCKRAMFHGGDSDSTGIIAACCYGATKGFEGVPAGNHMKIEYRDRLVRLAQTMMDLSRLDDSDDLTDDAGDTDVDGDTDANVADDDSDETKVDADVDAETKTDAENAAASTDSKASASTTDVKLQCS